MNYQLKTLLPHRAEEFLFAEFDVVIQCTAEACINHNVRHIGHASPDDQYLHMRSKHVVDDHL